jgi:general secretion pathway protein A
MYTEHFGFTELPFHVTFDPRFFYSNRLYQDAFTGVRWSIKLRRGLIAMTGPTGTGKTTLLKMVAEKFESNTHATLISRHHQDLGELLRRMLIDFGLTEIPDDRPRMIQELKSYLTAQFEKDRIVGVLLDEAQKMDVPILKQLELLSDLATDDNKLLQIVLVGSPELETTLEHPELRALRQRLALWCRLAPLKDHEVSSYIDYRLMQAGYKGQDLFAPDAVEQIVRFSKGIPRQINTICDNALLTAYRLGQKTIPRDIIHTVARDLRVTEEFAAETAITDSYGGRSHVGDPVSGPKARPGQKPRSGVVEEEPSPFTADQAGKEPESRQIPRLKNLGLSKIANFLIVGVLVGSAAALYFFEQSKLLGLNKTDRAGTGLAMSEGANRKPYPEVPDKEFSDGIPPIQVPAPTPAPPIAQQPKPLPKPSVSAVQKTDPFVTRVYLHTSKPSDRVLLEQIADVLRTKGYVIPDTRLSSSKTQGDVRFFFSQDRRDAESVKSIVELELRRLGYRISLDVLERDGDKFQFAAPGKIEVWVPPLPKS